MLPFDGYYVVSDFLSEAVLKLLSLFLILSYRRNKDSK